MSLLSNLIVATVAFSAGYVVGSSEDNSFKNKIETITKKVKPMINELEDLAIETLSNLEGKDSDEWKANISKGITKLNGKFNEYFSSEDKNEQRELDELEESYDQLAIDLKKTTPSTKKKTKKK